MIFSLFFFLFFIFIGVVVAVDVSDANCGWLCCGPCVDWGGGVAGGVDLVVWEALFFGLGWALL